MAKKRKTRSRKPPESVVVFVYRTTGVIGGVLAEADAERYRLDYDIYQYKLVGKVKAVTTTVELE